MISIVSRAVSTIAVPLLLSSQIAVASTLPTEPVLTLEAAQRVVAAAQATAQAEGWPCVIAVVDSAGRLIVQVRMDHALLPAGVDLAPEKARTAALFRRPSGALEDAINGNRPAVATARGFVLMRGGVPIVADGQVVGAIGVSTDTPVHDEQIAKAGAAALGQ
ncbi:glc operon protein GlcG [Burkholderia sp. WP9]|uniref:GlcG/HbpS family heme-binding protein n=1 Tax=Burkholderia sp. WP9 TaxID=1500263 RepID=UPI0008969DF6|nr:heme-binding protein [Burkholderia sp. WP9]SEF12494.1 glc operon protein GlcG [Burkholderia sp. WP9]